MITENKRLVEKDPKLNKDDLIVIGGAGGFIGSHLMERLIEEAGSVRALVHYNSRNSWGYLEEVSPEKKRDVEVILGGVADSGFVRSCSKSCDMVWHLAALIGIPFSYHM